VLRQSIGAQVLTPFATAQSFQTTSDIDTNRFGASGLLTHRLTKRISLNLRLTWNQQSSSRGTLAQSTDFSNFLATFGVFYKFDPIHVW